jgi:hypothetical protein
MPLRLLRGLLIIWLGKMLLKISRVSGIYSLIFLILLITFLWLIEPISNRLRGVVYSIKSFMFMVVGLSIYVISLAIVSTSGVNPSVFINKSLIKALGLLETSYVQSAVLVAFPIFLSGVSLGVISPLV